MLRHLLYGRLAYPAYHALKGDGINKAWRELSDNEWLDAPAIAAVQREKLTRLLKFAGCHVPYYGEVIRRLGRRPQDLVDASQFRDLPVLDKETIRREGHRLHAVDGGGRFGYPNSTSGSTGEPVRFLTDAEAHAVRMADIRRGKHWAGFRLGDREVALWGAQIEIRRARRMRGQIHELITGNHLLSSFDLSVDRMDDYIRTIQRLRPTILVAYPSALEAFAEHCATKRIRFEPILKGVICSAETLWAHQRALFERVFGEGLIYNRYGSREVGVIAQECPGHCGLHVSADRLLIEVLDERGRPCPPGVSGEVLVTDLESYAMPFIRYRIGDHAAWSGQHACPCGRKFPLLAGVSGRSMDVVRAPNGRTVAGNFFSILFRTRDGIKRFQVVQHRGGDITIRYVPDTQFAESILEYFTREIQKSLSQDLSISYQRADEIEITESGKQRLIISDYRPHKVATESSHAFG